MDEDVLREGGRRLGAAPCGATKLEPEHTEEHPVAFQPSLHLLQAPATGIMKLEFAWLQERPIIRPVVHADCTERLRREHGPAVPFLRRGECTGPPKALPGLGERPLVFLLQRRLGVDALVCNEERHQPLAKEVERKLRGALHLYASAHLLHEREHLGGASIHSAAQHGRGVVAVAMDGDEFCTAEGATTHLDAQQRPGDTRVV
mmetsp:Transcript_89697/g.192248  ORF Transcript_89697/g.192248 Transcript_89697/m.192248 type:complete len:204 (-) Transcript_89697:220-831(-)